MLASGGIASLDVFDQRGPLAEELKLFDKLRAEIGPQHLSQASPEMSSDLGLLRFLRGHQHDLALAAQAYRQASDWLVQHDAARWREALMMKQKTAPSSVEAITAHYTNLSRLPHWHKRVGSLYPERVFLPSLDSHGNPVMLTTHDMIANVLGLMTGLTAQEYDEFRVARAVNLDLYLDALSRLAGGRLIKCVYVWDVAGMTRALLKQWESKPVKRYFTDLDQQLGSAFPEQVYRLVCVNVPTWLMMLWAVAKRMVPGRTMKKISVHPTSSSSTELAEDITGIIAMVGGKASPPSPLPPLQQLTCDVVPIAVSFGCTKTVDYPYYTSALGFSLLLVSGTSALVTVEQWCDGELVVGGKPFRVDDFYQAVWRGSTATDKKKATRVLRVVVDCRGASSSFWGFAAGKSLELRAVPFDEEEDKGKLACS